MRRLILLSLIGVSVLVEYAHGLDLAKLDALVKAVKSSGKIIIPQEEFAADNERHDIVAKTLPSSKKKHKSHKGRTEYELASEELISESVEKEETTSTTEATSSSPSIISIRLSKPNATSTSGKEGTQGNLTHSDDSSTVLKRVRIVVRNETLDHTENTQHGKEKLSRIRQTPLDKKGLDKAPPKGTRDLSGVTDYLIADSRTSVTTQKLEINASRVDSANRTVAPKSSYQYKPALHAEVPDSIEVEFLNDTSYDITTTADAGNTIGCPSLDDFLTGSKHLLKSIWKGGTLVRTATHLVTAVGTSVTALGRCFYTLGVDFLNDIYQKSPNKTTETDSETNNGRYKI